MSDNVNLSVNGRSQVPPGFRFHPTEEELLHYYLRKKVASQKIDLDVIREVDLNKLEPWDLQEICKIGSTPQNDWYFFSHKDKKYPTGTRTNRATAAGFWKATGRDKIIHVNTKRIGMRKTLVFYRGRAPHGQKSDWIMHEYRLDDNTTQINSSDSSSSPWADEGWVVCRVFKKKNYYKTSSDHHHHHHHHDHGTSSNITSNTPILDQILMYIGRSSSSSLSSSLLPSSSSPHVCKQEFQESNNNNNPLLVPSDDDFAQLPPLENTSVGPSDWIAMDRLVASQLDGGQPWKQLDSSFNGEDDLRFPMMEEGQMRSSLPTDNNSEISEGELWNFVRSSSGSATDPLCHLSV